jgi:hypothetical protein
MAHVRHFPAGRKNLIHPTGRALFSYRRKLRKLEPRRDCDALGDPLRFLMDLAPSLPRMDKPLRHD